jgi:hypothetical protein
MPLKTVTLYASELTATAPAGAAAVCQASFSAISCLGLTKANGTIIFEAKCDVPAYLDSSKDNQVEITSSGGPDTNEWGLTWMGTINLTTSYAEYSMSLANSATSGGELNPAGINFFRMYGFMKTGTATLYVRNVRLRYMPKPYGGLTVQIP